MFPEPLALLTTRTPSLTVHGAGDLSRVDTHSSRFFPSKRTIASDGGSESLAPGITTLGSGSQTSVSLGLPRGPLAGAAGCCAKSEMEAAARRVTSANRICIQGY